jgi:transposase-like protein
MFSLREYVHEAYLKVHRHWRYLYHVIDRNGATMAIRSLPGSAQARRVF